MQDWEQCRWNDSDIPRIQLKEFRIQRITVKELEIQYVESKIHSVESRILDFFRINLLRAFLDFYFPGER